MPLQRADNNARGSPVAKVALQSNCAGRFHRGGTTVAESISSPVPWTEAPELSTQHFLPLCGSFMLFGDLELRLQILSPSKTDGAPYCRAFGFSHTFQVIPQFPFVLLRRTRSLVLMSSVRSCTRLVFTQVVSSHFSQLCSYLQFSFVTVLSL